MAAKRSDASPYLSRFGGGWVTPKQYLAENMCDRQARVKGRSLPDKFWALDEWRREYSLQNQFAAGLCKLYSVEAVVRALRTPEGKRVLSLGAPWLDPLVRHEQAALDRARKAREALPPPPPPPAAPPPDERPREPLARPSILGKLRELD